MRKNNIKNSGFSLAKRQELIGDDFYDVKTIGNLTVGIVCDGVGSATEGAQAAKRVTNYLMNNLKKDLKHGLLKSLFFPSQNQSTLYFIKNHKSTTRVLNLLLL